MLRLSDKLLGPSWRAVTPVSFNIYSSTNPDMITVYYYPKDATADSEGDDKFTSFKKQLVVSYFYFYHFFLIFVSSDNNEFIIIY